MKKADEGARRDSFFSLISARIDSYRKGGARKSCEIAGEPLDPWKALEAKGYKSSVARPDQPALYARKLNFAPGKMLTMRQVLDWRVAKNAQATEAVTWVRDVYTDHYFDSWGEWSMVSCDQNLKEAVIVQTLLSDMDLLKQKSFFAHAIFGKYRSAFKDNGKTYLNERFEHLKEAAQKLERPI